MKTVLIAQGIHGAATLEAALADAAPSAFDRLDVAVAYATKQGIRALQAALGSFPVKSRWVVGLDDAITQPEALAHLLALPGAELRIAALAPERRFHPKLYCMWQSDDEAVAASAVGSGNMTLRGLRHNGETAVLLTAETKDEANALKAQWRVMWALGKPASQPDMDAYLILYKQAKKQRQKIIDLGIAPEEPDAAAPIQPMLDGDPATARYGWLEVGTATQGTEVEIPKPLLPYFRLPTGQNSAFIQFRLPGGGIRQLRLIDRKGNAMWRIEFSAEAIQSVAGRSSFYQPNGARRSEHVLAFEHLPGPQLRVRSVVVNDPGFADLVANSSAVGAARRTVKGPQGRAYGVF